MIVFLDYQSSKPVDPRVVDAVLPYHLEQYGNPSSLHYIGDMATSALEESREKVASFINAHKGEIIFTSGATEANNLALIGYAIRNRSKGTNVVISEVEHISIHNTARFLEKNGFTISRVPVDHHGKVMLDRLKDRLSDNTILVSVGYASNEIGTIQSIPEIGKMCRDRDIVFHSDAVAAEGLVNIDVVRDNIDMLTLSSNDIYGPKGVGALYIKSGIRCSPVMIGGGQEQGMRSGTENMPGIVGMAAASEIMRQEMDNEVLRLKGFRDTLINSIPRLIPRAYLNGHPGERLPNNTHFRFDGIEGESLLLSLKDKGIAVSTGSACSSKTLEPSRTLIALGLLHEEAHGSLELTCGRFTSRKDIDTVLEVLPDAVIRLRELSPLYKGEQ